MSPSLWRIVRRLVFLLDAETAHHLTLKLVGRHPRSLGKLFHRGPDIRTDVGGVSWRTPIGLAAGLDKDAAALPFWEHLGFGSIEIGTVTAHAQAGNPKPRLHRLLADEAVVNRMGFNNHGSAALAERLQRYLDAGMWPSIPVGINLGKSKITPLDEATEDYLISLERVQRFADWITVNVSSPNTPGLRDLQRAERLAELIGPIVSQARVPVWLKLSPDLASEDLAATIEVAVEAGVTGLIATNTTLTRDGLSAPTELAGGLSGRPLWPLAHRRIVEALELLDGRVPLIGVGGIHRADHVRTLLDAGCAGVQLYTGLIYEGPGLPAQLAAGL